MGCCVLNEVCLFWWHECGNAIMVNWSLWDEMLLWSVWSYVYQWMGVVVLWKEEGWVIFPTLIWALHRLIHILSIHMAYPYV